MNALGQITQAIDVVKTFEFDQIVVSQMNLAAARTATEGLLLVPTTGLYSSSTDLVLLESTGTIAWARSVGMQAGMTPGFPTINHSEPAWDVQGTHCMVHRGRIFYSTTGLLAGDVHLAALDMNGDLDWMWRYDYNNTMASYFGLAADGSGGVYIGGNLQTGVGLATIFLQAAANGELKRADLYPVSPMAYDGKLAVDQAGRRILHSSRGLYDPDGTSIQILVADTLGSPGRSIRVSGATIPPHHVQFRPHQIQLSGDHLAVSGSLRYQHMDLGNTLYYDVVGKYAVDEIVPCLMDDTLVQHIPVPLDLMNIAEPDNPASLDVTAYYSSTPITLNWSDTDLGDLEDLCTFVGNLLGVEVGVSETHAESGPLVINTLVLQGSSIVFADDDVQRVEVHDMQGALVQRTAMNGARTLSTMGWTSGVYLLRAMTLDGTRGRVARVVVVE